jgi:hypothetical protein
MFVEYRNLLICSMDTKKRLYTYVLRTDDGAAPNPFWDICTLAICKPGIRSTARKDDWIIGTGSAKAQIAHKNFVNLSDCIVYAMKVTCIMSLEKYNEHCQKYLKGKLPDWDSIEWPNQMGDCIYYDFTNPLTAKMRDSVHSENKVENSKRDLKGKNVLLSNHFYYFGLAAKELPLNLRRIIKRNQGHKITSEPNIIAEFEEWISQFEHNKLYADPQLKWQKSSGNSRCEDGGCIPKPLQKRIC